MRLRSLLPVVAASLALVVLATASHAVDGNAAAALEEIGQVNGVALACNQPALSSRARNAVATGAPKTRDYGEIFEAATNAAFLNQGRGSACPDAPTLSQQLDQAEKRLRAAFPPAQ